MQDRLSTTIWDVQDMAQRKQLAAVAFRKLWSVCDYIVQDVDCLRSYDRSQ